MLGADMLSHFDVDLDLPHQRLVLYKKTILSKRGAGLVRVLRHDRRGPIAQRPSVRWIIVR